MKIFWPAFLMLVGNLFAAEAVNSRMRDEVFGSDDVVELVRDAEKVEVSLLRYTPPPGKAAGKGERYDEAGYVGLDQAVAQRLRQALLDTRIYEWDIRKGCLPRYGIRMRLTKSARTITIDFCMSCKIFMVDEGGKPLGGGSFDYDKGFFRSEFAKIFPKQEIR